MTTCYTSKLCRLLVEAETGECRVRARHLGDLRNG